MRIDGLRDGAHALRYWDQRQQVVAHNLANASTHGFKAQRVFAELMGDTFEARAATDVRGGSLGQTGNPLDLAIEGAGFFVVNTEQGERLTRGGAFRLDTEGRITDAAGNVVLGDDGAITVRGGKLEIDERGNVLDDGVLAGRLRVVVPGAGAALVHEDGARFRLDGDAADGGDTEVGAVRQGMLEASNVDALAAMVEMISIQRAYSAVQTSLRVMDGVMEKVANQIGRLS